MLSAILGLDVGCRESATQHGKVRVAQAQHYLPPAGHNMLARTLCYATSQCVKRVIESVPGASFAF